MHSNVRKALLILFLVCSLFKSGFLKTMDWRIVAVFTPIVLAISWAVFNIGRAALGQLQLAVKNFKKNQSWSSLACFHPSVFLTSVFESFLWTFDLRLLTLVGIAFFWWKEEVLSFLLLLFRKVFTVLIVSTRPHLAVVRICCLVKYSVNSWFGFDLTDFHLSILVLFWIQEWYGYFGFDFL